MYMLEGVLQQCVRGGRRQVFLVMFVLLVYSLYVLVHQSEPRTGLVERLRKEETLLFIRSSTTTRSRSHTLEEGNITKIHPPQDSSAKRNSHLSNPFSPRIVLSSWPPKVQFPLMVFSNPGRLGNRLNSYATALTFHNIHHASTTIAVTSDTIDRLLVLLDPANLTLPVVGKKLLKVVRKKNVTSGVGPDWLIKRDVSHLKEIFKRAKEDYTKNGKARMYMLGGYPNRMWMLAGHHHTIRAAFRFKDDLKQKVGRFMDAVRQKKGRQDITFVGFHIRRTDFKRHLMKLFSCTLPGPAFFRSAMNHYRATLHKPVFVVASDDLSFARQHLNASEDVVFSDMQTAAEDMALLGSCSHSIVTVGSFGFWASFLAGGEVVYPLLNNCSRTPFIHPDNLGSRGFENWKPFDFNGGGPL